MTFQIIFVISPQKIPFNRMKDQNRTILPQGIRLNYFQSIQKLYRWKNLDQIFFVQSKEDRLNINSSNCGI